MKKILFSLLAVAILATSCSKEYTINGTLTDNAEEGLRACVGILHEDLRTPFYLDTVNVDNNTFIFKGNIKDISYSVVNILNKDGRILRSEKFALEPGDISLELGEETNKIGGTKTNVALSEYRETVAAIDKKVDELEDQNADDEEINRLEKDIAKIAFDFAKKNIKNSVGVHSFINTAYMMNIVERRELIAAIVPEKKDLGQISRLIEQTDSQENTGDGKKYVDVKGINLKGEEVALSNYVGKHKLVLVDFWASWCPPCRKEMPALVTLYDTYKGKGLEIVGISIDHQSAPWAAATDIMNMTWPQMSDLKGWQSDLSAPYGVSSIPLTLLIDENGTIVARGLHGKALAAKVDELLK